MIKSINSCRAALMNTQLLALKDGENDRYDESDTEILFYFELTIAIILDSAK